MVAFKQTGISLSENYPMMSFPEFLHTKSGHPQARGSGDLGRDPVGGGGVGDGVGRVNQTTRKSKRETRRDQMTAHVSQQLTLSQVKGPGAN